jgi:hypothetical protein
MASSNGKAATSSSTTEAEKCCTNWKRLYNDNNGKHHKQGRWVNGKWWGPAPDPFQAAAALQVAVAVTSDESVLVGFVGTQVIQFNMESENQDRCERIYHGFVVSDQPVPPRPDVNNIAKQNGLPGTKKWPWR